MVDAQGHLPAEFDWQNHAQGSATLDSIVAPHVVRLDSQVPQELGADAHVAALLQTNITSRDRRQVSLWFTCPGQIEILANGMPVFEIEQEEEPGIPPGFRKPRKTRPFELLPGRNTLMLRSQPPPEDRQWWRFSGRLRTTGDHGIVDLTFDV
jgi:hypothetical protein